MATLIAYFFKWDVPLIGEIPSGLPSLQLAGLFSIDSSAYGTILEYALLRKAFSLVGTCRTVSLTSPGNVGFLSILHPCPGLVQFEMRKQFVPMKAVYYHD